MLNKATGIVYSVLMHIKIKYGDVKVSTGVVSLGKRVVVRNHYKIRKLLKINDNDTVALAA